MALKDLEAKLEAGAKRQSSPSAEEGELKKKRLKVGDAVKEGERLGDRKTNGKRSLALQQHEAMRMWVMIVGRILEEYVLEHVGALLRLPDLEQPNPWTLTETRRVAACELNTRMCATPKLQAQLNEDWHALLRLLSSSINPDVHANVLSEQTALVNKCVQERVVHLMRSIVSTTAPLNMSAAADAYTELTQVAAAPLTHVGMMRARLNKLRKMIQMYLMCHDPARGAIVLRGNSLMYHLLSAMLNASSCIHWQSIATQQAPPHPDTSTDQVLTWLLRHAEREEAMGLTSVRHGAGGLVDDDPWPGYTVAWVSVPVP